MNWLRFAETDLLIAVPCVAIAKSVGSEGSDIAFFDRPRHAEFRQDGILCRHGAEVERERGFEISAGFPHRSDSFLDYRSSHHARPCHFVNPPYCRVENPVRLIDHGIFLLALDSPDIGEDIRHVNNLGCRE